MNNFLTHVINPFFYWLVIVVANRNLLRLKDGWRQGKGDRNEKAMEFQ